VIGVILLGNGITGLLLRVYAMRMAAVFTISTATITLRAKVIPGWTGILGFAVAAVLLVSVGLTPWIELLFPAWILLLSIDILRTGLRSAHGGGRTAIGAQARPSQPQAPRHQPGSAPCTPGEARAPARPGQEAPGAS